MSEPRQLVNLGSLNGPMFRDAIHIAVLPCVAGEILRPGQHVGFLNKGGPVFSEAITAPIGIVDPFLRRPVMKTQRFNLLLYPNTITSLRHEWTHPQIDQV